MDLTGTAAIITGGKRIGAAIAVALAQRGVDIALTWRRSEEEAQQTADAVRAAGRRVWVTQADLSRAADCRAAINGAAEAFGRLDILVAMASVYKQVPFDQLLDADWDANIQVDLGSSFYCATASVPHMRKAGGGRMVMFSDWLAASGRPRYKGFVPYYVAKAGVIALGESLALELASDNILVNMIAPGPIVPPPDLSEEEAAAAAKATPLGRWGGEDVIVKAALSLIETDFITGEVVRVDGGRHLL
jgi:NAD(P)-dependent dehydrogenase (short-subunit alcohol dehydrogenase family)